jgi:hypothetical protein
MENQNARKPVRIELTEEQKRQIKEVVGREASAVEFDADELEDRIAPFSVRVDFH